MTPTIRMQLILAPVAMDRLDGETAYDFDRRVEHEVAAMVTAAVAADNRLRVLTMTTHIRRAK